jgi:hypothetical protein
MMSPLLPLLLCQDAFVVQLHDCCHSWWRQTL